MSGVLYDYVITWMKVLSHGWEYIWFLKPWDNKACTTHTKINTTVCQQTLIWYYSEQFQKSTTFPGWLQLQLLLTLLNYMLWAVHCLHTLYNNLFIYISGIISCWLIKALCIINLKSKMLTQIYVKRQIQLDSTFPGWSLFLCKCQVNHFYFWFKLGL